MIINDINLAMKFADKISQLSKGKIEKVSKPQNFFDKKLFMHICGLEMT
tara:strand:- start:9411 stop:9557 length:147 start_codon:yes stop_codon:yes gene_type:complete